MQIVGNGYFAAPSNQAHIIIMEIQGTVHLLFEQSGTFKNVFKELGYTAYDYDIQNEYGQTDYVMDIFHEITNAYSSRHSIFDKIRSDDLIIAFFPCIYFCEANVRMFRFEDMQYLSRTRSDVIRSMVQRSRDRQRYWELILKLCYICDVRGLRLIVENPYSSMHYLYYYFPYRPALIDLHRNMRGDKFGKPTQYIFINCEPTRLQSIQVKKRVALNRVKYERARKIGNCAICGTARSEITPDYARNFICDNIIGRHTRYTIPSLFN